MTDLKKTEYPKLTLLLADSLARTYQLLGKGRGFRGPDRAYGQNSPVLLAKFDPDTRSLKTVQRCLGGDYQEFSATLPRSGMMRNGIVYQLAPLVRITKETGFGLLPTPTNSMMTIGDMEQARYSGSSKKRPSYKKANSMYATPQARDYRIGEHERWENPKRSRNLNDQVAVKKYPTPTANDAKNNNGPSQATKGQGGRNLNVAVGGALNPDWEEMLMGFPLGWTDILKNDVDRTNKFPQAWIDGTWENNLKRITTRRDGRCNRVRQLGNAVVQQIPEIIGRAVMELTT